MSQARWLLGEVERVSVGAASSLLADRRVLPGVLEVLRATTDRGVKHVLATGNSRVRAEVKLDLHGLKPWFCLASSAFGDETAEREELLRLAGRRGVRPMGPGEKPLAPPRVVVLGDTPADVAAAKLVGYPVIGVASGAFSMPELLEAAPDLLVSSLRDRTERVIRFLMRD